MNERMNDRTMNEIREEKKKKRRHENADDLRKSQDQMKKNPVLGAWSYGNDLCKVCNGTDASNMHIATQCIYYTKTNGAFCRRANYANLHIVRLCIISDHHTIKSIR